MASVYGLNCVVSAGGNTGVGKCSITVKHIVGDILIPKGKTYPASSFATLIATLQADAKKDNKFDRIYPITVGYEQVDLANQDRTTQQYGYGRTVTTRPEMVGRTYTINQNECLNKSVAQFRDKPELFDRLAITADGAIIGTEKVAEDGSVALGGFALDTLYVSAFTEPTVAESGFWTITEVMKYLSEWDKRLIIKPEVGNVLTDLEGLQNVILDNVPQTPVVAGSYHIRATTACGGLNMADLFPAEMVIVGNWVATNFITGGVIPITSITITGNGNFLVVLDTVDPNFVNGQRIKLCLSAPSVLESNGIENYESNCVILPNA